eukprot:6197508-Pleurochrysis_carterae.AAC.7
MPSSLKVDYLTRCAVLPMPSKGNAVSFLTFAGRVCRGETVERLKSQRQQVSEVLALAMFRVSLKPLFSLVKVGRGI